jgi:hypothetical protein
VCSQLPDAAFGDSGGCGRWEEAEKGSEEWWSIAGESGADYVSTFTAGSTCAEGGGCRML